MRKARVLVFLFGCALFAFCGCQSVPQLVTASNIIDKQTDSAIETATVSTLADSNVQDAEHLLSAVKDSGNADLVYIAEKHVAETKKIAEKSKAIQVIQKEERTSTSEHLEAESKAETVAAEVKEKSAVANNTLFMLKLFEVIILIVTIIALYLRFRLSIKKLLPFLP